MSTNYFVVPATKTVTHESTIEILVECEEGRYRAGLSRSTCWTEPHRSEYLAILALKRLLEAHERHGTWSYNFDQLKRREE